MSDNYQRLFISQNELAEKIAAQQSGTLNGPKLSIVDGSWYLPAMNRDGKAEYAQARIPGAVFFDIDDVASKDQGLPHMLPPTDVFAKAAGKMGISVDDEVVVYDGPGIFSSARVWWTFWIMGCDNIRVLPGGMDAWKAAGLPIETGPPPAKQPAHFEIEFDADDVQDFDYMLNNIQKQQTLVLDARPRARFIGEMPEPRAGLHSGHIPGSRSLPSSELVRDGALIPVDELREKFRQVGFQLGAHTTTTCGSGVTAAIISLALEAIGHPDHSLYDGSWAEWGSKPDVPVARWD
ncbi:MAG: sulfurtransferase [Salaquimonas sp.]